MPRRLMIIGGIYCLLGALAALGMFLELMRGVVLHIQMEVLLLPIGLGLLKARPSSRRWATFWAAFVGALTLAGLVFVIGWGGPPRFEISELPLPDRIEVVLGWAFAVITPACCALVIWMLYTPPVSSAFTHSQQDTVLPV